MNKKGQALVEFVIILPIFLFLLLCVIDIGRIMYTKISLEEDISDVVDSYQKGKNIEDIKTKFKLDGEIKLEENGDYIDIYLIKDLDIITPGLNLIFADPYKIEIKRSILNG